MLNTINNHRTIRKYSQKTIDDITLTQILEAGIRASTTGNMQVYSMVITKSSELKDKLWQAHFKQNMVLQAPVIITFCADFNRFSLWCEQRNAKPVYDNFLSFITAAIDAMLVAQNVALAAETMQLGICYLGTTVYNANQIIELLELPKLVVPITSLVLGYAEETPELTDRLPLSAVVHNEKYQAYSAEFINKMYEGKENLSSSKKWVTESNKETLAQIFTDIRYTQKDNCHFSQSLLKVLTNQGFMNNILPDY